MFKILRDRKQRKAKVNETEGPSRNTFLDLSIELLI
jgi:hypothetical protein